MRVHVVHVRMCTHVHVPMQAASFFAVDVRTPWRSAFVEWIVHNRAASGKTSELLTC